MLEIAEAETAVDREAIIGMAKHQDPEIRNIDAPFKAYADYIRYIFGKPGVKMWVARDNGRYVGYTIAFVECGLNMHVFVMESGFIPDYRGQKNIRLFADKVMEWTKENGFKKFVWVSDISKDQWEDSLGKKIKQRYLYCLEV